MNKNCNFCGNKNFETKKVQYIYKQGSEMLLVNSVPAEVCEYCGEKYFESSVLKKIESEFINSKQNGKTFSKFIKVPIEEYIELE